jgi:hypothetical protein
VDLLPGRQRTRHLGFGSPEVGELVCDGGVPRLWSEIKYLFRALSFLGSVSLILSFIDEPKIVEMREEVSSMVAAVSHGDGQRGWRLGSHSLKSLSHETLSLHCEPISKI